MDRKALEVVIGGAWEEAGGAVKEEVDCWSEGEVDGKSVEVDGALVEEVDGAFVEEVDGAFVEEVGGCSRVLSDDVNE